MNKDYKLSAFDKEWGLEVASGGYSQVPNDFLRNVGMLGLSTNEAMVLLVIISYGKKRHISAKQIAEHLGISVRTVRAAFRKLHTQRELIHRNYEIGEANTFSFGGLKRLLIEVAKNRQAYRQNKDRGLYAHGRNREKILPTNKETNNKYKKEGGGYEQFMKAREEMIKKKSV